MLGMAPVGAADMKGYDTWVAAPRPKGMKDVGSRQSPSIERIAALQARPDRRPRLPLDQEPQRSSRRSRRCWSRTRTRRRGSQLNAMVTDFRRLADAVGRKSRGESVLQDLSNNLARNKTALKRGGRAGASVAIATPGGTTSAPAIRMFTTELADRRRRAPARPARRLDRDRALRLRDGRARGRSRA